MEAIKILKHHKEGIDKPIELWKKLNLGTKSHNSQMDVVLALWEHHLIL